MTICALLKPPERRECAQCHENRPLTAFAKHRRICRVCQAQYMKQWHAKRRATMEHAL
jgi:uncharacterized protein (DUF983 family)